MLQGAPTLNSLDVRGTRISEEAAKAFEAAMPKATFSSFSYGPIEPDAPPH
jgi:hypothetical protein